MEEIDGFVFVQTTSSHGRLAIRGQAREVPRRMVRRGDPRPAISARRRIVCSDGKFQGPSAVAAHSDALPDPS